MFKQDCWSPGSHVVWGKVQKCQLELGEDASHGSCLQGSAPRTPGSLLPGGAWEALQEKSRPGPVGPPRGPPLCRVCPAEAAVTGGVSTQPRPDTAMDTGPLTAGAPALESSLSGVILLLPPWKVYSTTSKGHL